MTAEFALTIRQPWAWAVAAEASFPGQGKMIENRGEGALRWRYRGDLLIHAGMAWAPRGALDLRVRRLWAGIDPSLLVLDVPELPAPLIQGGRIVHWAAGHAAPTWQKIDTGAFLAVVELVDIHPGRGCCKPWGEDEYITADGRIQTEVTHLVFENCRVLKLPLGGQPGRLGLWHPPGTQVEAAYNRLPSGV